MSAGFIDDWDETDMWDEPDGYGKGGKVKKKAKSAKAGKIKGQKGTDKVPLWGTAGEYILPRKTVKELGGSKVLDDLVRKTTGKNPGGVPLKRDNDAFETGKLEESLKKMKPELREKFLEFMSGVKKKPKGYTRGGRVDEELASKVIEPKVVEPKVVAPETVAPKEPRPHISARPQATPQPAAGGGGNMGGTGGGSATAAPGVNPIGGGAAGTSGGAGTGAGANAGARARPQGAWGGGASPQAKAWQAEFDAMKHKTGDTLKPRQSFERTKNAARAVKNVAQAAGKKIGNPLSLKGAGGLAIVPGLFEGGRQAFDGTIDKKVDMLMGESDGTLWSHVKRSPAYFGAFLETTGRTLPLVDSVREFVYGEDVNKTPYATVGQPTQQTTSQTQVVPQAAPQTDPQTNPQTQAVVPAAAAPEAGQVKKPVYRYKDSSGQTHYTNMKDKIPKGADFEDISKYSANRRGTVNVIPSANFTRPTSGNEAVGAALMAAAKRGDWDAVRAHYAKQGKPFAGDTGQTMSAADKTLMQQIQDAKSERRQLEKDAAESMRRNGGVLYGHGWGADRERIQNTINKATGLLSSRNVEQNKLAADMLNQQQQAAAEPQQEWNVIYNENESLDGGKSKIPVAMYDVHSGKVVPMGASQKQQQGGHPDMRLPRDQWILAYQRKQSADGKNVTSSRQLGALYDHLNKSKAIG